MTFFTPRSSANIRIPSWALGMQRRRLVNSNPMSPFAMNVEHEILGPTSLVVMEKRMQVRDESRKKWRW